MRPLIDRLRARELVDGFSRTYGAEPTLVAFPKVLPMTIRFALGIPRFPILVGFANGRMVHA